MKLAILGATGAVGREMLKVLEERSVPMELPMLLASERSEGKILTFRGEEIAVQSAEGASFAGVDAVLGAVSAETARRFAPSIQRAGALFIDNSSAFRLCSDVPLVIPYINGEDAFRHSGIVANPNCVTIIALTAVYAVSRLSPIRSLTVSTYQAVSGAGNGGIESLRREWTAADGERWDGSVFDHPIGGNLIPLIGQMQESGETAEEEKLRNEGRRIMHLPHLAVSCTAVRVPILRCHSVCVNVETEAPVSPREARDAIAKAKGCVLLEGDVPPMPSVAAMRDEVFVGRIRRDETSENGLSLFCVGDQLRRGAASNAVDILEMLLK